MWNRNNEESAVTRRDVEMFKSLKNNTSYNYTVLKKIYFEESKKAKVILRFCEFFTRYIEQDWGQYRYREQD